jgi:hypothetical protein
MAKPVHIHCHVCNATARVEPDGSCAVCGDAGLDLEAQELVKWVAYQAYPKVEYREDRLALARDGFGNELDGYHPLDGGERNPPLPGPGSAPLDHQVGLALGSALRIPPFTSHGVERDRPLRVLSTALGFPGTKASGFNAIQAVLARFRWPGMCCSERLAWELFHATESNYRLWKRRLLPSLLPPAWRCPHALLRDTLGAWG